MATETYTVEGFGTVQIKGSWRIGYDLQGNKVISTKGKFCDVLISLGMTSKQAQTWLENRQ